MKQFDYYQSERPEIAKLVPEHAIRILDVGCGAGNLGRTLLRQNPNRKMYGVEMIQSAAEKAKEAYVEVHVGELEKINIPYPEGYFDVIIFADVLEHLLDPWSALAGLRKYLNDDGVVVSSIPNIAHWSILNELLNGSWYYVEAGILDKTHLRFFTRKSILTMYRNSGFQVIHLGGTFAQGQNPFNNQAFRNGLDAIGFNAEQSIPDSDVFQYLTVAKKSLIADKTSLIVVADERTEITATTTHALRKNTSDSVAEIILVADVGKNPSFYASLQGVQVVSADSSLSFSEKANIGVEKATGANLCFLTNDILVADHWLERLFDSLSPSEGIVGVGPLIGGNVDGAQNLPNVAFKSEADLVRLSDKVFYQFVNNWSEADKLAHFCLLLKRDSFSKAGGFNQVLRNERTAVASLCNKIKEQGGKLIIAEDVLVCRLPFSV